MERSVMTSIALALTTVGVPVRAQIAAPGTAVPEAPAGVTAFIDVHVIPMDTERVLPDQTVLVAGGRITALGPASQVAVPTGATQIDGHGKYLLPGFAEMHTHLLANYW